jgi:MFS family permease
MTARGLAPLRHRGFRFLVAGQLGSNVGDAFYAVALPWYVLATHGGALLLGGVLAAYGIARASLLTVGGQLSDRWRPWTVMMATDIVRVLAAGALAVAASLGPARAVVLVPIAAVLGAGEGLFMPGSFAIVPALLPSEDLQAGNALTSAGTQLAMLAGPALGGAMVALLGPAPAFALDAASFALSALTLAALRGIVPAAPDAGAAPATGQLTVRALVRSERILQIGLLIIVAANLGSGGLTEVALPALAHGPLHTGAGGYGALIAALGAGALLGTLVAAQVRRAQRPFVVGSLAFLAEAAAIALIPYLGSTLAAAATLVAFGLLNGFGNVVTITAFQRWAPPSVMGRLAGLLMLASLGVFPVSVALAALVVHGFGPALFFPLAAVTLAAALLAGLSQRTWRNFGAITPTGARRPDAGRLSTASTSTDSAVHAS